MIAVIKPFIIPSIATLIGLSLLFSWGWADYFSWKEPVLGAVLLISGAYGLAQAANAKEEDYP